MTTGPEMLIQTLVRALKLEPQVDKVREALTPETIERFQAALKTAEGIDERLKRIERALGIEPGPDTGTIIVRDFGPSGINQIQSRNGTDN